MAQVEPPPAPPQATVPPTAPLASSPLPSSPPLSLQLLLAQSVYKLGTTANWTHISQLVESAEEWPEEAAKMTQQGYESAFNDMMRTKGLDASACSLPQARPVRKLIHLLYTDLLVSLRDKILGSHTQEMKLRNEIEQIKSGQVDQLLFNAASPSIKERLLASTVSAQNPESSNKKEEEEHVVVPSSQNEPAANVEVEMGKGEEMGKEGEEEDVMMKGPDVEGGEEKVGEEVEEEEARIPDSQEGPVDVPEKETNVVEEDSKKRGKKAVAAIGKKGRKGTGTRGGKKEEPVAEEEEEVEDVQEEKEEGDEAENENEIEDGGEEEDGELDGEVEGEGEEMEDIEKTRGGRKKASVAKRGTRTNKRKASEPVESPLPAGDSAAEGPASKRKRGGRKSRAELDAEQEASPETKESKQLATRRKASHNRILETIRSLPFSSSFESKVTKKVAPNYIDSILRPICLKDISKRIKNGEVSTNTELMRDFALLCANAVQFNGDEGENSVGRQAKEIWEAFEREMNEILSTEFPMGANA
ncbi:hypothetical protein JCM16303_004644 [Sporobolomyces ruberrimus]